MAREPYSPVPGVEPTGPSGANLQINANPSEFGALPARAMQQFGQSAEEAGNTLMQTALARQQLTNEADARTASNAYMKDAGTAWSQYGVLSGKAAADAYPQFAQKLQDLQTQHADSLASPMAKQNFLNASSYMLNRLTLMGSTHASTEERNYWKQSHASNVETASQWGVLMQNDPHTVDTAAASIADSVHQLGKMNGQDDTTIAAQTQGALGKYYREVIESQVAQNPAAAMQTFDRVKSKMDAASIAATDRSLRAWHDKIGVDAFVQHHSALTGPDVQPAQQGLTPTKVMNGLIGTEASGDNAVSPAGATGKDQIIRSTFDQYALHGESYASKEDRHAAAQRYVDDMWKKYPGDIDRIAVGYFSGTGNIAPQGSSTPWLQNRSDGNLTTEQYVNRFAGQLHTPPSTYADQYSRIVAAEQDAARKFPGRPDLQREAVNGVRQSISIDDTMSAKYDAAVQKQIRDQEQSAENDYVPKIISDPTSLDVRSIATDDRLSPEKKWRLNEMLNTALKDNPKVASVSHQTATHLLSDMRLPEDNPQRVADMTPVYDAYQKGNLTNADFNFVQTQFKEMQTPDGQRLNDIQSKFLQAVKPTIEKSNPLMGQLDMTGGTEFFRLQQDLAQKVSQYRKDGKNPYDLFDPSKPDYIGKPESIAPYQKSIPESVSEFSSRMQQQAVDAAASSAPRAAAAAPSGPPPVGLSDFGYGTDGPAPAAQPQTPRRIPNLPMAPVDTGRKPSLDEIFGTPPASATPH